MNRMTPLLWLAMGVIAGALAAGPAPAAAQDLYIGSYKGSYQTMGRPDVKALAKVWAESSSGYRILIRSLPTEPEAWPVSLELSGRVIDGQVIFWGMAMCVDWTGNIKDKQITATMAGSYGGKFTLTQIGLDEQLSPTLEAQPPAGAVVLLPFKKGQVPDMSEWDNPTWKTQGDGTMMVGQGETKTRRAFGSCHLHLEFCLPLEPTGRGQSRGNSGLFFNERYEVQVLDSFALAEGSGDCGSIYHQVLPRVNASLPPQVWQTYDIDFTAPKLDASGAVQELPVITIKLNGVTIQDHEKILAPTANPKALPLARGRLSLQDHSHKVRYRNIWLVETK